MLRTVTPFFSRILFFCVGALSGLVSVGQALPCTGTAASFAPALAQVGTGAYTATGLPANTSVTLFLTTTVGSTAATIGGCNAALIANLAGVVGPSVSGGTTITGGTCPNVTLSAVATATGTVQHTFILPPYTLNYPPIATGVPLTVNCSVCPALFTAPICANQYVRYFMCPGRVYTISLCSSSTSWNSTLSVVTAAGAAAGGFVTSNDDGCAPGGHATLTYVPATAQEYHIRVLRNNGAGNFCISDPASCGTIEITCANAPSPPLNDNPCAATPLTVSTACTMLGTTTSWATASNPPGTPACGAYAGNDVWYTAVVPASGNLAIQTNHVGATNLAMQVYTTPLCNSPAGSWVNQGCSQDLTVSVLEPFINISNIALAGQTVYIRVWPQSSAANGGSFEICAYQPVPPLNDNPCGAFPVTVAAGCPPVGATSQSATPSTAPAPGCGNAGPLNDLWFTVQVPVGSGVTVNANSTALDDMAMAIYTAASCAGPFTQVGCSSPAGATPPTITLLQNGTTIVDGTILYVRVWNLNAAFGGFSVCATPNLPPDNNEPCTPTGAFNVPVQYGCLFTTATNTFATTSTPLPPGVTAMPNPTCGTPTNDVWFTVQVPNPFVTPANLVIDTDDGSMTDAAMAIYRSTGGCGGSNLALTQLSCVVGGSTNGPNMPVATLAAATLVPGEILYVRVWRQSGTDGTFQICARRTDLPAACSYTLRMLDSAGDGWDGSFVTICVDPVGPPPPVCTNYTIGGALGFITFGANLGDLVTVSYTAAGTFQNQISYQLNTPNGGQLFNSGTPPGTGLQYNFVVDALCNVPPAPQEDCVGAVQVCSNNTAQSANPANTGSVADLNASNSGCLITYERRGVWYSFQVTATGQLGFTINPFPYGVSDYDYGVWGPYSSITCPPPGPPIRCSWADGPSLTGLNFTATDLSEGVFGDSWTRYLDVVAGQWYLIFVDNWYMTGFAFDLSFQLQGGASIDCTLLPVTWVDFTGVATSKGVELGWTTGSEEGTSHFVVERSSDRDRWEPIGTRAAAGNSSSATQYTFLDDAPLPGTSYYRLRQVDIDGSVSYSTQVSVNWRLPMADFQVYPNPAGELIQASFSLSNEDALNWRVIDMSGRTVLVGNYAAVAGANLLTVPLGNVDQGSYLLEITDPTGQVLGNTRFVHF